MNILLVVMVVMCGETQEYDVINVTSSLGSVFLTDINNNGDATGYVCFKSTKKQWHRGHTQAILFRASDKKLFLLGTLCPKQSTEYLNAQANRSSKGLAINDERSITGWSFDATGKKIAFIWSKGVMKRIMNQGSEGKAIGPGGEVVGSMWGNMKRHAFLYTGGRVIDLGSLIGSKGSSDGLCVADVGGVLHVGGKSDSEYMSSGFVWSQGNMKEVPLDEVIYISPRGTMISKTSVLFRDGRKEDIAYVLRDANAHGMCIDFDTLYRPGLPDVSVYKLLGSRGDGRPMFDALVGISDRGHIVANYRSPREVCGVIATPKKPLGVVSYDVVEDEDRLKLVFITHGWATNSETWVSHLTEIMKRGIEKRDDRDHWKVIGYDWRLHANSGGIIVGSLKFDLSDYDFPLSDSPVVQYFTWPPQKAAEFARDLGRQWGRIYSKQNPEVVHLIGHSAGTHFIHAMCEPLNDSDTWVHATFLDAYEPNGSSIALGAFADFAEHYRCSDKGTIIGSAFAWLPSAGVAGDILKNCFNVDVAHTPSLGLSWSEGHSYPTEWYVDSEDGLLGLKCSPVFAGKRITHADYPRDN